MKPLAHYPAHYIAAIKQAVPNVGVAFAFFEKSLREITIRDATPDDAAAACEVLRRSIVELCGADHHDKPAILAAWLRNKTPEIVGGWIAKPDNSVLLAVEGETILAVGAVTDRGEIALNYVSPDARFRGISRALIEALEARTLERGNDRCTLTSTQTARRFYLSRGYVEGPAFSKFPETLSYPMSKRLRE